MPEGTPPRKRAATGSEIAPVAVALDHPQIIQLLTVVCARLERDLAELRRIDQEREEAIAAAEAAAAEAVKNPKPPEKDVFRQREGYIAECDLGVTTLCGSWFHRYDNGQIKWQGIVVAEPQPGCYLVELHNWKDGGSAHQRVVTLKAIAEAEEGYEWRFYDSDEWMRMAGTDVGSSVWEADREHAS